MAEPIYTTASLAKRLPPSPSRRGFLRGLASLPLIGGSVALIGQPSAVAGSPEPDLLEAYKTWLDMESRCLAWDMAADPVFIGRYAPAADRVELSRTIQRSLAFVGQSGSYHRPGENSPYARAALVLSAVGCDWRETPHVG